MILTTPQVAEKLGVSGSVVHRMVRNGDLETVNRKKDGAQKFFPKFDSKVVEEYRRARRAGRQQAKVVAPENGHRVTATGERYQPGPVFGFLTVLNEIEQRVRVIEAGITALDAKLDDLYALWK